MKIFVVNLLFNGRFREMKRKSKIMSVGADSLLMYKRKKAYM